MSIKKMIKRVIAISRKKELVPIVQNIDENEVLIDKVAVILGGSGGIGIAIAKKLMKSGCKVILCGTSEKKLNKCLASFNDKSLLKTMIFDITDFNQIELNVQNAVRFYGHVDILVNSVGVHTENVDFFEVTQNEYDRVMSINLKGTYFTCQKFGEYMKNNHIRGHILLVSSSRGFEPAWSPYGISKWSLNSLIKGLAQILIPYGIVVNGVAPGSTATQLIGIKDGDSIYTTENRINRLIMPEEVANVAQLLVSDAGNMIIGEIVKISAGRGDFDIR